jgi:TonB family protein
LALAALACGDSPPPPNSAAPAEEPPVPLNADPAVQYPPDLYDRRVEGDVVLRLFVDSTGRLAPESTRIAESSGNAALDSAAIQGVGRLRYAPARRHGVPVATTFLQTVEFRHPASAQTAPGLPPARPGPADTIRPRVDSIRLRTRAAPDTARARTDTAGANADSAEVLPHSAGP